MVKALYINPPFTANDSERPIRAMKSGKRNVFHGKPLRRRVRRVVKSLGTIFILLTPFPPAAIDPRCNLSGFPFDKWKEGFICM